MNNLFLLFSALAVISITSCKQNPKEGEPEVVTVDNTNQSSKTYEIAKSEAEFNDPKVEAAFNKYLDVQEALVNTDASQTASETSELELILSELNPNKTMMQAIANIVASKDIEVQRENFEIVNTEMEMMLNGALKSGTLYKQFCPMAFKNKGAYWISSSKKILNPYFGDKMLACGRVDSEIK